MLSYSPIDAKYDVETKLENCSRTVRSLLNDKSFEPADTLSNLISKGQTSAYEDVHLGLLYLLLTESNPSFPYTLLVTTSKDGLSMVVTTCSRIVAQKWNKLLPNVSANLIWLFDELMKAQSPRIDGFITSFIRTLGGSDLSEKNLNLSNTLVNIFLSNMDWTTNYPLVVPSVVFVFLRLIEDHCHDKLTNLRQLEAKLCVNLLKNHWSSCAEIGRDLIRLLQNVASVPEIESFWAELSSKRSNDLGIWEVLKKRTSWNFLSLLLPYEMEERLRFMFTSVRFGFERPYQEWFKSSYLTTELTDPIRVDIIRYLCCAYHPTNEQLSSDLITRYAIIGWLFCDCKRKIVGANMRLALFYDWLFFESDRDIMDIEPAILLLVNSLRVNLPLACSLIDYICRIPRLYFPAKSEAISDSVQSALHCIINKKVISSFAVISDSEFLPRDLSQAVARNFCDFCQTKDSEDSGTFSDQKEAEEVFDPIPSLPNEPESSILGGGPQMNLRSKLDSVLMPEIVKFRKKSFQSHFDKLTEPQRALITICQDERNVSSKRSESFDRLLNLIIINESWLVSGDSNVCLGDSLAVCVGWLVHDYINNPTCQSNSVSPFISAKSSKHFFDFFVFNLFRLLCQLHESKSSAQTLCSFYRKVRQCFAPIGYLFLLFLESRALDEAVKFNCYSFVCELLSWDLVSMLTEDFIFCAKFDRDCTVGLVIGLTRSAIGKALVDNCTLLKSLSSRLTFKQLDQLNCAVLRKEIVLITDEGIESVLHVMSKMAEHSQQAVWAIIQSHCLLVESYLTFLSDFEDSESFRHLIYLITTEAIICRKPTMELVSCLMSLTSSLTSKIISTALSFWDSEDSDKLSTVLGTLLIRQNKRLKRVKHHVPIEAVVRHLECYRRECRDISLLFTKNVIDGLKSAYAQCGMGVKKSCAELFALAGCETEFSGRGKKPNDLNSSDSEDP